MNNTTMENNGMKRFACLVLCVIALISMVACGQKTPIWQEQYDLGVRYLSEGNYEEAIIAFTAAIEIDPKCPEAYLGVAETYIQQGKYDEAYAILEEGLDQTEGDQDIANQLKNWDEGVYRPLNSYGGTEFIYRLNYYAYDDMTEVERNVINVVGEAVINKDMDSLYDLLDDYTEESQLFTNFVYAIWNGYKISLDFRPYCDDAEGDRTGSIEIEMRSENGIGYYAVAYHTFAVNTTGREHWWNDYRSTTWASCPCVDWQWNGEIQGNNLREMQFASVYGNTSPEVSKVQTTGTMAPSGSSSITSVEDQSDGTDIYQEEFKDGVLISSKKNGEALPVSEGCYQVMSVGSRCSARFDSMQTMLDHRFW